MSAFRTTVFAIGALSAAFFSPVVAALAVVILAVRYRAWEAVMIGAVMDILWLPYDSLLYSVPWCTCTAALLVWGFEPLRREFLH